MEERGWSVVRMVRGEYICFLQFIIFVIASGWRNGVARNNSNEEGFFDFGISIG